jgi:hypothetical protein
MTRRRGRPRDGLRDEPSFVAIDVRAAYLMAASAMAVSALGATILLRRAPPA